MPNHQARIYLILSSLLTLILIVVLIAIFHKDPTTAPLPVSLASTYGQNENGNIRPPVTNDGQMVRRRQAIAVHLEKGASQKKIRRLMAAQAKTLGIHLTESNPDVLDAVMLQEIEEDHGLVYLLDGSATQQDASQFQPTKGVEHLHFIQVLVHELRFHVPVTDPEVQLDIANEGILYDSLGHYTTSVNRYGLDIYYAGQLLSDRQVILTRLGLARATSVKASEITVNPSDTEGTGVLLRYEPKEELPEGELANGHNH